MQPVWKCYFIALLFNETKLLQLRSFLAKTITHSTLRIFNTFHVFFACNETFHIACDWSALLVCLWQVPASKYVSFTHINSNLNQILLDNLDCKEKTPTAGQPHIQIQVFTILHVWKLICDGYVVMGRMPLVGLAKMLTMWSCICTCLRKTIPVCPAPRLILWGAVKMAVCVLDNVCSGLYGGLDFRFFWFCGLYHHFT